MRFVWAVVAFILATLLIGAGIAQRTIFMGPETQELSLVVEEPQPYLLVDGAVLREQPGQQTLFVRGEGELFVAYGRTADLEAWLSDAAYNSATIDEDGLVVVNGIEPELDDTAEDGEEADAAEPAEEAVVGRSPVGSDLWLHSFNETDQLITDMQLPEGMSLLIARDGTAPAPEDVVVSWPLDTTTPWAGPLVAVGCAVMLAGLVMYVLGIRHQRRGRGPRRKGPGPLPATEPIDLTIDPLPGRDALERPADGQPGRGQWTAQRRRRVLSVPVLGLAAVMIAGCSSDSWPDFTSSSPSPSPTQTVIAPENQRPPAVTDAQASRILQNVSTTLEEADAARDLELAKTRLAGAALAARTTDYTLRGSLSDRALPAVIPTDVIEVLLPQATESWPRTVLVLSKSKSDDTVPPVILTMTQADPWANYKVTNIAEMQASAEVPQVAPAWIGTSLITENAAAFLQLAPADLAAAFSDVVDAGEKSEYYDLFDPVSIALVDSLIQSRAAVKQALADKDAADTTSLAFDIAPSAQDPVALATLESGAIVAVSFVDSEKITPTSGDAVIKFGENPEAKALTGVEESAKGVTTTYGLQMFFAVPAQGSTEQIKLLAVHQDLLNVEVIK
ncbi:glycosyl transferase [uncultured Microbacterium sp.]|uniref:glycosyl transferase n=1 Tax=uncultured Microbacterium sp. TaxID=191216 RepID=UPI002609CC1D|nr:glycosyl transferase [uncultured Microbacterium sp.]